MNMTTRAARVLWMALLLTGIWYLLSGRFDLLHFGVGALTALLIALNYRPAEDVTGFRAGRFLLYVPWLIGQIVISNLRVARAVLTPRMPISPTFVRQRPDVVGPRALTLLGSSITLTPGTLTIDVDGDEIFIHALDSASVKDVRARVIEHRVGGVFPERSAS